MNGRGFTLIEVLVAVAIFALAAVVLGAAYINVLQGYAAVAQRQEREADLRQARGLVLGEPERAVVQRGGTLGLAPGRSARWSAALQPTSVADLFRVAFRCEIRESAHREPWVREEVFYLLRPTWSEPGAREQLRQQARVRLGREAVK